MLIISLYWKAVLPSCQYTMINMTYWQCRLFMLHHLPASWQRFFGSAWGNTPPCTKEQRVGQPTITCNIMRQSDATKLCLHDPLMLSKGRTINDLGGPRAANSRWVFFSWPTGSRVSMLLSWVFVKSGVVSLVIFPGLLTDPPQIINGSSLTRIEPPHLLDSGWNLFNSPDGSISWLQYKINGLFLHFTSNLYSGF